MNGWGERLGDAMLAAAFIDRLLHRGIIVGNDSPSCRMRSYQALDLARCSTGRCLDGM
ncbi:ATP-binding protein [Nonomuraea phyllanthi]|uniref:ATP-binding protein n=1 Tax=Nonomuraea phyllanthi TaxID=2219224 RepID=UPI0037CB2189